MNFYTAASPGAVSGLHSDTIQKLISDAQTTFSSGDKLIFLIVLATVTLLPPILCVIHNKGAVKAVSLFVLAVYIFGNLSFTILNREVIPSDSTILPSFSSYRQAFYLDWGIVGTLRTLFHDGFRAALSGVHIWSREAAREFFLNILLYLPLGYLLPFAFRSLRGRVFTITFIGFLCSVATEVSQLYFHIGYCQVDDVINNTLGCLIGAIIGCILVKVWRIR